MPENEAAKGTTLYCSFCGKSHREVKKLISGPSVQICNECVELCNETIIEESTKNKALSSANAFSGISGSPLSIFKYLSDFVIGQRNANRALALILFNHVERENFGRESQYPAQNVLLIGPTGVGKTMLVKKMARILNIPIAIASATEYTAAGYVGADVENLVLLLLQSAKYDVELAQRGIIFVDEIDKIAGKFGDSTNFGRDVGGVSVQQAMLTMIEGSIVSVPPEGGKKHAQQEFLRVDTSNILFVFSGAFVGIDKIIEARMYKSSGLIKTFTLEDEISDSQLISESYNALSSRVTADDIIKFGLIPEFVGRVSRIISLNALSFDDFIKIIKNSKDSPILYFQQYFARYGAILEFSDNAIEACAKLAHKANIGARALRSTLDTALENTMFNFHQRTGIAKVYVDEETINSQALANIFDSNGRSLEWTRKVNYIVHADGDEYIVKDLETAWAPLIRSGDIVVWSSLNVEAGQRRLDEISYQELNAKTVIFIVTANFLASDYTEADYMEKWARLSRNEDVHIFWMYASPCLIDDSSVTQFELLNLDEVSISGMNDHDRMKFFGYVANRLKLACAQFDKLEG